MLKDEEDAAQRRTSEGAANHAQVTEPPEEKLSVAEWGTLWHAQSQTFKIVYIVM